MQFVRMTVESYAQTAPPYIPEFEAIVQSLDTMVELPPVATTAPPQKAEFDVKVQSVVMTVAAFVA